MALKILKVLLFTFCTNLINFTIGFGQIQDTSVIITNELIYVDGKPKPCTGVNCTGIEMTFRECLNACDFLSLDGREWEVPTVEEILRNIEFIPNGYNSSYIWTISPGGGGNLNGLATIRLNDASLITLSATGKKQCRCFKYSH